MPLKDLVRARLRALIEEHIAAAGLPAGWRDPVVRFGNARHRDYPRLRVAAVPDHFMPEDVLSNLRKNARRHPNAQVRGKSDVGLPGSFRRPQP